MSDDLDPDDDGQDPDPTTQQGQQQTATIPAAELRVLRKAVKQNEDLGKKLAEYQQRDALRDAGIDLKPLQVRALFNVHEGEATPEALKATALELGYIQPPDPEVPDAEIAAHRRTAEASAGGAVSGKPDYRAAALEAPLGQQGDTEFWENARKAGLVVER